MHVALLMGGASTEHEVSLKTGAMIAGSLDRERFKVTTVTISREGLWSLPGERGIDALEALALLRAKGVDCLFLALHGQYGEDGRIQGLLDFCGIPYTGSGCLASALAFDKVRAKAVVAQSGIPVAKQLVFTRSDWDSASKSIRERVARELGFPCVIKNPCQGSSIGMAIPQAESDFEAAMLDVLVYGDMVMIEEFLVGRELTCGVLDCDPHMRATPLPPTEIRPIVGSFFDYRAKYEVGGSEEITPAPVPNEIAARAQAIALQAHELIGCRGLSRSDMILTSDGPVWIEVNTLPGMTETSLFPQAAAAVGIAFPTLLTLLIDGAIAFSKRR